MAGSIRRLPDTLCSSVRSGFIISDLTKVVEELVYNSLDAEANKVLVSVGVDNGYVKVDDNGFGISRDGLVLLGERYTTSKHCTLPDSISRSFGSRGEVLCSIADVSLLEIISKAQGRPNAYRKVIKGSKCLYLGIDADRRGMGTSVTVHDIFYNQPVRRTHMQISPKKVLHSIRKCVLQIAIVRPEVSFSVVDVESGDELLCTHASSSSLPILRGQFGIDVTLLHELSLSEGPFELIGYVSVSVSSFSTKAIQFVYINSRFIDKSPIHKVLNRMATTCWEQSDHNKFGKRSRPQACASYCLNLTCPEFLFDLHLEQVKTCAEFKDWQPVLSLIEKSVASLWNTEASNGEIFGSTVDLMSKNHSREEAGILTSPEKDADALDMYELPRKRFKTQSNHARQHSLHSPLFSKDVETQEIGRSSYYQDREAATISSVRATKRINELELDDDFYCTYPSRAHNYADPDCSLLARGFGLSHPWDVNDNIVSVSEDVTENIFIERHDNSVKNCFGSREMAESLTRIISGLEQNSAEISPEIALPTEFEDDQKPFLEEELLFNDEERSKIHIDHLNADEECVNSWGDQLPSSSHKLIPFLNHSDENLPPVRKYNRLLEDHICLQGDDESTRLIVFSPESNETKRSYVPSHENRSRLFLRNCNSLQKTSSMQLIHTDWPHFEHEHRTEGDRIGPGGLDDGMKIRGNQNVDECSTIWLGDGSSPEAENDVGERSPFLDQEYAVAGHDRCHSVQQAGASYGSFQPSVVECSPTTSAASFGAISWDFEQDSLETHWWNYGSRNCANFKQFKDNEQYFNPHDLGEDFECKNLSTSSFPHSCLSGRCEKSADEVSKHFGQQFSEKSSVRKGGIAATKTDLSSEEADDFMLLSSMSQNRSITSEKEPQIHLPSYNIKRREIAKVRRSNSAPPIYKGKKKLLPLIANSATVLTNPDGCTPTASCEIKHKKCTEEPLSWPDQFHGTSYAGGSTLRAGQKMKEITAMPDVANIQNDKKLDSSSPSSDTASLETKWRNDGPQAACGYPHDLEMKREKLMNVGDKYTILDVSSGILHLSSDAIVPKSISRMCFEDSKVLLQVDKKFIPIVAGKTLAVLDQHAADERIRLEELRNEVLSGKRKTMTYLEEEKEMILPETAYQLLHNYSDHIRNWGWICNIHEASQSFSENLSLLKRKPGTIKLLTCRFLSRIKQDGVLKQFYFLNDDKVPCILGVNLSDTDLLEFLEQLAHTDGSSTVPPSVLRVLNNKACRGAIMFGDSLLPSECALIFEELKKTSLCFQCAHGRPTMAPLVNLVALHEQIEKLSLHEECSSKPWHGLRRHPISLDRAKQRLGR